MLTPFYRLLLDPEAGEGGAAAESPPARAPGPTPEPKPKAAEATPAPQADPSEGFKKLVDKHQNDALSLARQLYQENYDLREKNRDLKGRVPKDGSVVLAEDDARALNAYKALGDPDSLKAAAYERDQFRAQVEAHDREKVHRAAAALAGYDPDVFADFASLKGLDVEVREDKDEKGNPVKDKAGKPVKVAVVKGDGDGATPLAAYVLANESAYLPALKGAKVEAEPPRRGTPPEGGGVPQPPVRAGGQGPRRSLVR